MMEISMKILQNAKSTNSFQSSCSPSWYLPESIKESCCSDTFVPMFILAQLIIPKSWKYHISPSKNE